MGDMVEAKSRGRRQKGKKLIRHIRSFKRFPGDGTPAALSTPVKQPYKLDEMVMVDGRRPLFKCGFPIPKPEKTYTDAKQG